MTLITALAARAKVDVAGLLQVVAQLGFVVTGFIGLERHRDGTTKVLARSITFRDRPAEDLFVGGVSDRYRVRWTVAGSQHSAEYLVDVADDGQLHLVNDDGQCKCGTRAPMSADGQIDPHQTERGELCLSPQRDVPQLQPQPGKRGHWCSRCNLYIRRRGIA